MKKVLVTGGSGFIGSGLVKALVRRGHNVRVLDNNFRGCKENLREVAGSVDLIEGDIRVMNDVRGAAKGVDTILHLAYINGTKFFYENPRLVLDVAIRGQLNIIDAAEEMGIETLAYASSSEVYQTPSKIPTPEDVSLSVPSVVNPRYSYGGGKIISELLLLHYAKRSNTRKIIFRPHNVYGPAMGFEHVIPQLIEKIFIASRDFSLSKAVIPVQGDGAETRAFCYIDDAVRGILLCVEYGKDGDIFHVGTQEEIQIGELTMMLGRLCGVDIKLEPGEAPPGGTKRRCPDISHLKSLGYEPRVDLAKGLSKTLEWYKDYFVKDKGTQKTL